MSGSYILVGSTIPTQIIQGTQAGQSYEKVSMITNTGANVIYVDSQANVSPTNFDFVLNSGASIRWESANPCYAICDPGNTSQANVADSSTDIFDPSNIALQISNLLVAPLSQAIATAIAAQGAGQANTTTFLTALNYVSSGTFAGAVTVPATYNSVMLRISWPAATFWPQGSFSVTVSQGSDVRTYTRDIAQADISSNSDGGKVIWVIPLTHGTFIGSNTFYINTFLPTAFPNGSNFTINVYGSTGRYAETIEDPNWSNYASPNGPYAGWSTVGEYALSATFNPTLASGTSYFYVPPGVGTFQWSANNASGGTQTMTYLFVDEIVSGTNNFSPSYMRISNISPPVKNAGVTWTTPANRSSQRMGIAWNGANFLSSVSCLYIPNGI